MVEKKRITLIIPPSIFLADARVFVSLGILKVAAVLEKAKYPVDVLDLSGISNYTDVVDNYFQNSDAKVAGITATTPQMPAVENIYQTIRNVSRETLVILGGPHATVVNAARKLEVKKGIVGRAHKAYKRLFSIADIVVAGDGEEAIFEAIKRSQASSGKLRQSGSLVDADDPASNMFLDKHRLSELPPPARHLIDLNSYHYYIGEERATSLIMQLGCPWGCRFCSGRLSPSFRRVRIRDIDKVSSEIEQIYRDYRYRGFMMYDDELNANPNMIQGMQAMTNLQSKLGVDFQLRGFIKADQFNEQQALAMKEAGFKEMCIGFESGAPRILKNIKKQATVDQNTRCLQIAKKYGLRVKAFTSVGHPGESEETIKQTHDWLIDSEVDDFDTTIISTFPGTPYYDEARQMGESGVWVYIVPETGDRLYSEDVDFVSLAEYYKGQIEDGYRSYVHTDFLSADDLVNLRDWVERDVRARLNIPFYKTRAAILYDHSMGQLPGYVYRGQCSSGQKPE